MLKKIMIITCVSLFGVNLAIAEEKYDVSNIYFHMGVIGAFAEMVHLDVKKIGLSEMFTAEDAEKYEPVIKQITDRNGVLYYQEDDFLVTDLYPPMKTEGLSLFIIYKGDTLNEYLALKAEKQSLIEQGKYDRAARKSIAYKFGKLLSYPDKNIEELVAKNGMN
jgi:hypothetical protein